MTELITKRHFINKPLVRIKITCIFVIKASKWPRSKFSNNSRNLRVFINWQFPIFIKNRQALLLTTIGFLKVQNSSFEVDPKCRQTSHSYSTLHREKAKRCLKLNQTTINRIAWWFLIDIGDLQLINTLRFLELLEKFKSTGCRSFETQHSIIQ